MTCRHKILNIDDEGSVDCDDCGASIKVTNEVISNMTHIETVRSEDDEDDVWDQYRVPDHLLDQLEVLKDE